MGGQPDRTSELRAALGGDEAALCRLLSRQAPVLRTSVSGSIPGRHRAVLTADDVVQQTFVDAFRGLGSFAGSDEAGFGAWLSAAAKRNLTDAVRALDAEKRGGRRRAPASRRDSCLGLLAELSGGGTPSHAAAAREALTALERAVGALPEEYRRVVEGYDLAGRPMEEVAASIGRSRGAAYMLRARAHRMIRELIGSTSRFFSRTA